MPVSTFRSRLQTYFKDNRSKMKLHVKMHLSPTQVGQKSILVKFWALYICMSTTMIIICLH